MSTAIRVVTEQDVPLADQKILIESLKAWRSADNPNPLIPCDVDIDGDGLTDAYGLDGFGNLIYMSGVQLHKTVFTAEGGGEATPKGE